MKSLILECQVGEFLCDDGKCILEAELCNGVRDCDDGSDETSGYCTYNKTEGNSKLFFNLIKIHNHNSTYFTIQMEGSISLFCILDSTDKVLTLERTISSLKSTIKFQNEKINDLTMSYHELKKTMFDIINGKL